MKIIMLITMLCVLKIAHTNTTTEKVHYNVLLVQWAVYNAQTVPFVQHALKPIFLIFSMNAIYAVQLSLIA